MVMKIKIFLYRIKQIWSKLGGEITMRFINPKLDYAFKKIFGSDDSQDILISFLNAIIYEGKNKIKSLEIIDPYSHGQVEILKDSFLDVGAVLDNK